MLRGMTDSVLKHHSFRNGPQQDDMVDDDEHGKSIVLKINGGECV